MTYEQKLAEFRNLVLAHDLFYSYSDDHRVWKKGVASWDAINEASKEIKPEDAAQVWNEMVDKNVNEEARDQYYTTADRWALLTLGSKVNA